MEKQTPHKNGQSVQAGPCGHQQVVIDVNAIPKERLELMARPLLPAIRKAFQDPEFVAGYERWKAERDARNGQG